MPFHSSQTSLPKRNFDDKKLVPADSDSDSDSVLQPKLDLSKASAPKSDLEHVQNAHFFQEHKWQDPTQDHELEKAQSAPEDKEAAHPQAPAASQRDVTHVSSVSSAMHFDKNSPLTNLVEINEAEYGHLHIQSSGGQHFIIRTGRKALQQGLLVGRYERCLLRGDSTLDLSDGISRVHMLVILLDDQIYAIDTGSTNGIYFKDEEIRNRALRSGDTIDVSNALALSWVSNLALM